MADKPTWVFVAGTYRTASTTQYRMVRDVVEEAGTGIGIGYHTEDKLKEYDTPESGKFVVCKVFKFLPDGFRGESSKGKLFLDEGRLKATVTIRDPRDIAVSMMRRAQRLGNDDWDFSHTVTEEFPEWLGDLEKWIDLGRGITMLTRFEEMTANLYREVNRIADHLKIHVPKELAHDIASRHTISAIREHKRKAREEGVKEDPHLPQIPGIVFGTSGLYPQWLTYPQRREIEDANQEFMERFGYI